MQLLITGGAGYIGSHACKLLAARGHAVVAYDDLSRGHERNVRWGPFERGDVNDRDRLVWVLRQHRIDAVLHFAGQAYVGESMTQPGAYFRANTAGSCALFDALAVAGVRDVVFSSTCATYGEPEIMPIAESTPQRPVNPYGLSKLMAEQALAWFGRAHGLRWAALRYFNVAGCDPDGTLGEEHEPETHLIPLAIDAALGKRPPLSVFGGDYPTLDGTAVRDYIHVMDLVAAHVLALEHLRAGNASLIANLATGTGSSVRQVIDTVARVAGRPVPHAIVARRPGDPPILVADPSHARTTLGWRHRYGLTDMIAHAWAWFAR